MLMPSLNAMAVFARVVDAGSFSAAARQLGMTPSAASRHVSRLEAALGTALLQRTTRAVALTEPGRAVYAACTRMLAGAREVEALAGAQPGEPRGLLRVSAPVSFGQAWLAPRLPALLARHAGLELQLSLTDRLVDLVEEGVDVAVRIARDLAPGLVARPLCAVRYRLVAAPAFLARHGVPGTPAALPALPCLYLGYGAFGEQWTLRREDRATEGETAEAGKAAGAESDSNATAEMAETVTVRVPPRVTVNNSAAIVAMAAAGAGIGLVPDFAAAQGLADGSLVSVLDDWRVLEPYAGTAYAVYTPTRHLAPKVRAFIDHLAAPAQAEQTR